VYEDLEASGRWMRLNTDSGELLRALSMFNDAHTIASYQSEFVTLSTISLVISTFRLLKVLDFQPRMGLVTRTITEATEDLCHFSVLFLLVCSGFAAIAYLSFGSTIEGYSEFDTALYSLFAAVVFGDTTQYDEMKSTPNAPAGKFFFWMYILVVMFVLFNVLLAILVDSYANVKESTVKDDTMTQEISKMLKAIMQSKRNGKISDENLLTKLESLVVKVKESTQEKQPEVQAILELPDFTINRQAVTAVAARIKHKHEEASTRELLLEVLSRFGDGENDSGQAKIAPAPFKIPKETSADANPSRDSAPAEAGGESPKQTLITPLKPAGS